MARAPPLPQTIRHTGQLEVPAAPAGRPLDLEAKAAQLVRELRAVGRADLPLVDHPRPRLHRHDPTVRPQRPMDQEMRVQLRIRRPASDRASRRVLPARRQNLGGALAHHRVLVNAATDHWNELRSVRQRPVDGALLGGLERRTDLGRAERPHGRHRLRRRERRVDRHNRLPVRADPSEGLVGDRVADRHQRVEGLAVDRLGPVETERGGTLGAQRPPARSLDSLAVLEVVVPLFRRLRPALEIRRVRRAPSRRDLRDRQHDGDSSIQCVECIALP